VDLRLAGGDPESRSRRRTIAHDELRGCDAAFYLVHSMMSADREYARRDLALAFAFAKAALDAGVRRIIYLGGLGETGSRSQ
jgi:hypothetical protein